MADIVLDYGGAAVSAEIRDAHRALWDHIRSPGMWWTGPERVAIAAASRRAATCALCGARKAALSPTSIGGTHDAASDLPPAVIDVVHRVRTDAARLTREWFEGVRAAGMAETHYVELVAVTTFVAGVDAFARALGIPPFPLPAPLPGAPSRHRPAGARSGTAWVPMIDPRDASGPEEGLYGAGSMVPNIMRALSLVPDAARMLRRLSAAHYIREDQIPDPTIRRILDRSQMELVAARVSALNQCFY
jgi:alkylhydroperoxidase family enzyme